MKGSTHGSLTTKNEFVLCSTDVECINRFYCQQLYENKFPMVDLTKIKYEFKLIGSNSQKGGGSGQGGCGGVGGLGGTNLSIQSNLSEKIKQSFDDTGNAGINAEAGKEGRDPGVTLFRIYEITYSLSKIYGKEIHKNLISQELFDNKRASSGYKDRTCNNKAKEPPMSSEISVGESEIQYLKYLLEIDTKFPYSKLSDSKFFHNLIEQTNFKPDFEIILKQLELFISFKYLHLLDSLKIKIKNSFNKFNFTTKEKNTLNYAYATISSVITSFNTAEQMDFVFDFEKYLEELKKEVKAWKELKKEQYLEQARLTLVKNIETEKEEASYILNELQNEVEINGDKIHKFFLNKIKSISKLKEESKSEQEKIIKMRNDLQKTIKIKRIFSGLKIAAGLLAFLGPKGQAASLVIGAILTYGEKRLTSKDQEIKDDSKWNEIKNSMDAYKETQNNWKTIRNDKIKTKGDKINVAVNSIKQFFSIKNDELSNDELNSLNDEIKKNANSFDDMIDIEDQIQRVHLEIREKIENGTIEHKNELNSSSEFKLVYSNWKLKSTFESIKTMVKNLFNHEGNDVLETVEHLKNTIETEIEIYRVCKNFEDRVQQVDYLSLIGTNLPALTPFEKKIEFLKQKIISNTIIEKYEKAVKIFSYWSFPFFCRFNNALTDYKINDENNIETVINLFDGLVDLITKQIQRNDGKFFDHDSHLMSRIFDGKYPFYQWTFHNYSNQIQELLSGESILLFADVEKSLFDAIKIKSIKLLIEVTSSPTVNKSLNQLLDGALIELKHSGVSNYRFQNKNYKVKTSGKNITLVFQYGSKPFEHSNYIFKSISKAHLSPFTIWEIRIQLDESNRFEVIDLMQNVTDIKVSLVGEGTYVSDAIQLNVTTRCKTEAYFYI